MQQISRNVYVNTKVRGCNVGFVTTAKGVVMIDAPMMPTEAVRWREQIHQRGEVRYLINTEHHFDHTIGNFFFPVPVVAHQGTKEAFEAAIGTVSDIRERVRQMDPEGLPLLEGYTFNKPVITFSNRLYLHLDSHTLELVNLPGHTPNETVVYIPEEKVLFSGDNVLGSGLPPLLHQAQPDSWLKSLSILKAMDINIIVPGHGEVCDKGAILETEVLLKEILGEVERAIREGLSREETADRITSQERYAPARRMGDFAVPLQRLGIQRLYDELRDKVAGKGA